MELAARIVSLELAEPFTISRGTSENVDVVNVEIRYDGAVYNPLYLLPLPPRIGQVEETDDAEEEHD